MATATAHVSELEAPPAAGLGRVQALWAVLKRKPLGAASATVLAVLVATAILADVIAPYDPIATAPEIRLSKPSRDHFFGTDDIGRDVFSRIVHGARIS